eukprot:1149222-Pelagomonas_calceolata.AAC.1
MARQAASCAVWLLPYRTKVTAGIRVFRARSLTAQLLADGCQPYKEKDSTHGPYVRACQKQPEGALPGRLSTEENISEKIPCGRLKFFSVEVGNFFQ